MTRTIIRFHGIIFFLAIFTLQSCSKNQETKKPNVLFICIDDLRPELGCYGAPQVKSPNIDKLASEGVLFSRAYCNVPVCGASRASLLTGVLPTKTRFVQYDTYAQNDAPNAKTLPQVFKEAGYTTFSFGKVFHHNDDRETESWSEPAWQSEEGNDNYRMALDPATMEKLSKRERGRIYESPDVADNAYPDGKIALKTIEQLQKFKKNGEPFFIACGFIRPHLPFYAPKKYWDMYQRDSIQLADNQFMPENAPAALHGSGEFNSYHLAGLKPKSEAFHRVMKHGYLASVSYIDKLIGDVLQELKKSGLDKNTIVVIWGDHGWHLGEHNFWGKHNTMHLAMKVPLIIRLPENKNGEGSNCSALLETTDIFPTICELAGLSAPKSVQGKSFTELFQNTNADFRQHIYSRFVIGDAVVTQDFSYTRYSGKKPGVMMYDLKNDPDENTNIAGMSENKTRLDQMQKLLDESIARAEAYQ